MAFNKIMLGDIPIIDLTNDTVTADKLLEGITAHARNGEIITGSMTNHGAVNGTIDYRATPFRRVSMTGTVRLPLTARTISFPKT